MPEVEQVAAPEAVQESAALTEGLPGATDTPETVAETDEQKNQRELEERQKRSERASRGIQKRFDELTAEKHAEKREKEQLLALVQQLVGRGTQQAPQAQGGEPAREQFQDYESYIKAHARWEARQEAKSLVEKELGAFRQQATVASQQQQAAQIRSQFEGRMAEYAKATPDFESVVLQNDDVDIPNEAAAIVHTMEDGPAVLYAIGKNPALAQKLQGKNPLQQAMVLGQISAALKTAPQVSKAPPPGQPVGSRSAPSNELGDNDSLETWMKKRTAQVSKR